MLLPVRVPSSALVDLTALFVPADTPSGSVLDLIITVDDTDLNLRDLSAYLSLVDRVYGRLTEEGLRSYAQKSHRQLSVAEFRKGSLEIVISEALHQFKDATPIVVVWLFAKYMPDATKSISETTKNFMEAYKSLEEVRTSKENRKRLREEFKANEILAQLGPNRINQLVSLLDKLAEMEHNSLPAAMRLARKKVQSVDLKLKKK